MADPNNLVSGIVRKPAAPSSFNFDAPPTYAPSAVSQQNQGFGWNPQTVGLVGSLAGGALSAYQGAKASNDQKAMTAQQLAQNQKQFEAEQAQQKAQVGLQATQMDPFSQQRSRQKQALLGQLLQGYTPAGFDAEAKRFTGGLNLSPDAFKGIQDYFGPNAMSASEQAFQNTAKAASPTYQIPDYLKVGYQVGQGGLGEASAAPTSSPQQTLAQLLAAQQGGNSGASPFNIAAKVRGASGASGAGGGVDLSGEQGGAGGGGGFGAGQAASLGLSALPTVMSLARRGGGAAAPAVAAGAQGAMGLANSIAGPAALGASLAANYLPQGAPASAARGAGTGAMIGSFIPGVGTAIGAGIGAIGGAIKGHQNSTKGAREDFAKQVGTSLPQLYAALQASGPQGQALANEALNVIGKQDKAANQRWMQQVAQMLSA